MKLLDLPKKMKENLKAKLMSLWKELTTFDLQFSLDFKVINFLIGFFGEYILWLVKRQEYILNSKFLAVPVPSNSCMFWTRNLSSTILLASAICFYFLGVFKVDAFDMKVLVLAFSIAFTEVATKLLTFIFNFKSFRLLNEKIANDDGYFEEEMSIELPLRKRMGMILVTMISVQIPTMLLFASLPIVPLQLPLTRFGKTLE